MTILFTGRKADLTPALKQFAESKLGKLERVLDDIQEAHVILELDKHRHRCETVVKSRTTTLTARADGGDFRVSVAQCVDRLVAQAKKHHGRLTGRSRREGARSSPRRARVAELALALSPGEPAPEEHRVVRMGSVPVKPMSVDEALLQVRGSRDLFLVFRNTESQQVTVLFRRPDGRFGLVEAEA
jgi:ribosome hibernation promoting factor